MKNEKESIDDYQEHRRFVRNSFYSLFANYGNIIFQLINSLILARIISKETWGILILSTTYILIIITISRYFPPALDYSLNYFIPKFMSLNQISKVKYYIKYSIFLKTFFLIIVYFLSIIFFESFSYLFMDIINYNKFLFYILSPLIVLTGLNIVLNSIMYSYNQVKTLFIILILSSGFQIGTILTFFLTMKGINIETIAIINVVSALISFLGTVIVVYYKTHKMKKDDTEEESIKIVNRKIFKYGFPISFGYLVYGLWNPIQIVGINLVSNPIYITGYNISINYSNYSTTLINSFHLPLLTTFSRFETNHNYKEIEFLYNRALNFSLFLLLLISGILFFCSDFFLALIYGTHYLTFSQYLKIMILAKIFTVAIPVFDALLYAKKKVNYLPFIRVFMIIIYVVLFFSGLFFFGILGGIFSIIISNFIILIFYNFLTFKVLKINFSIKKLTFQYFCFALGLGISLLLDILFFNQLYNDLSSFLNLDFLRHFPFLGLLFFITIYLMFNRIFKIFGEEDLYFDILLQNKTKMNKFIRKMMRILIVKNKTKDS